MDKEELKKFHDAMCACCLVAEAMKVCPLCNFNDGLEARKEALLKGEQNVES